MFVLSLLFFWAFFTIQVDSLNPLNKADTCTIAKSYGYPCEAYNFTTQPGVTQTVHRIQNGKKVVLMMHDILGSSADFVLLGNGTNGSLAYSMAGYGFDVWLLNARGNIYSSINKGDWWNYNNWFQNASTWDFSWHELGAFDLNYYTQAIMNITNQTSKFYYIGYGQGATTHLVYMATNATANSVFKFSLYLNPMAFMNSSKNSFITTIAENLNTHQWATQNFGQYQFKPNEYWTNFWNAQYCQNGTWLPEVCKNQFFQIMGLNTIQILPSDLEMILTHTPAGASTKQFIHYAQLKNSGNFAQFDNVKVDNLFTANSDNKTSSPPQYNLTAITTKIAILYSSLDTLAHPDDILRLMLNLKSLYIQIQLTGCDHSDLLYSRTCIKSNLLYIALLFLLM